MMNLEAAKTANDNAKALAALVLKNIKAMQSQGQLTNQMGQHWTSGEDLEAMGKDLKEALSVLNSIRHPNG